jgi:hypothetical protein
MTDYGYEELTKWTDLGVEEQHEIEDSLRLENIIHVQVEDIEE